MLGPRLIDHREPIVPGKRKLIVAAESSWDGELYLTRPGNDRLPFSSVETFCGAFLTLTGWSLQPTPPNRAPAVRTVPHRRPDNAADTKLKFIIAFTSAWTGEVYLTRRGFTHHPFTTFEEFLCAVLQITGWSLDRAATATPRGEVSALPARGPVVTRTHRRADPSAAQGIWGARTAESSRAPA